MNEEVNRLIIFFVGLFIGYIILPEIEVWFKKHYLKSEAGKE